MRKTILFEDIKGNRHYVNPDYIVQLHTMKIADWSHSGAKIGEHDAYFVNVANAGVACYNAEDIEVSEETFNILINL